MKRIFKSILVGIFSTILIISIFELIFKKLAPVSYGEIMSRSTQTWDCEEDFFTRKNFRQSQSLGYEFEPNSIMGTNSLGMLDRERTKKKPEGVYRIISLGDSTTANSGYVNSLEKLLNKNKKDRRFEVWNCGVSGYGLIQYCRALKEKWLHCNPDMVIIGFCLNDFDTTPLVIRESNHLVGYFPHKEVSPKINPFLFEHSAFYRFIIMRLFLSDKRDNYNSDINKVSRVYLKNMKDLLVEKKINFLIVIFGLVERFEDYAPGRKEDYGEIRSIVKGLDIEFIDMVPVFEKNNPVDLKVRSTDELHFNQRGSQIIAIAIYKYLTKVKKI